MPTLLAEAAQAQRVAQVDEVDRAAGDGRRIDDDEVELREVDTLGRRVLREHLGVVAGVEQDALAADIDKRGVAPIRLHRRVLPEGIVQHGDLRVRRSAAIRPAPRRWRRNAGPARSWRCRGLDRFMSAPLGDGWVAADGVSQPLGRYSAAEAAPALKPGPRFAEGPSKVYRSTQRSGGRALGHHRRPTWARCQAALRRVPARPRPRGTAPRRCAAGAAAEGVRAAELPGAPPAARTGQGRVARRRLARRGGHRRFGQPMRQRAAGGSRRSRWPPDQDGAEARLPVRCGGSSRSRALRGRRSRSQRIAPRARAASLRRGVVVCPRSWRRRLWASPSRSPQSHSGCSSAQPPR